jgi:hypothetical protein
MAGGQDGTGRPRGLPMYGIAAVVGVVGAVLLGVVIGGGNETPVDSVASPSVVALVSAEPSRLASDGPSPSLVASESPSPSVEVSVAPAPTTAPTPTTKPTAAPTKAPTPTRTPRPTATPKTDPAIVSFTVPKTEDCTGSTAGTIKVSWEVTRATGVTIAIDGPGIYDSYSGKTGAVELPFGCSQSELSHTYRLTTTGGTGPAASRTKTVTAAAATIKSFTMGSADCPSSDPGSVAIAFAYEISAATGVELKRDGEIYSTYSGKTYSSAQSVVYDCTKASQTFVLRTTGQFGEAATKQRVVERSLP